MNISDAQREVRIRFHGGFYGQLVSGVLWLLSGCLAVTVGVKSAIIALVFGGFMIFPVTESLVRLSGMEKLSEANTLRYLGYAGCVCFAVFHVVAASGYAVSD